MATLFELKDEILKGRSVVRPMTSKHSIRLSSWTENITVHDALADDWTLEPLPKEKKKIKLYAYVNESGKLYLLRESQLWDGWVKVPNLDQEIEVDE